MQLTLEQEEAASAARIAALEPIEAQAKARPAVDREHELDDDAPPQQSAAGQDQPVEKPPEGDALAAADQGEQGEEIRITQPGTGQLQQVLPDERKQLDEQPEASQQGASRMDPEQGQPGARLTGHELEPGRAAHFGRMQATFMQGLGHDAVVVHDIEPNADQAAQGEGSASAATGQGAYRAQAAAAAGASAHAQLPGSEGDSEPAGQAATAQQQDAAEGRAAVSAAETELQRLVAEQAAAFAAQQAAGQQIGEQQAEEAPQEQRLQQQQDIAHEADAQQAAGAEQGPDQRAAEQAQQQQQQQQTAERVAALAAAEAQQQQQTQQQQQQQQTAEQVAALPAAEAQQQQQTEGNAQAESSMLDEGEDEEEPSFT